MDTQRNWWVTLISLGMAVLGVAAVWSTIGGEHTFRSGVLGITFDLIVPLLIAFAGLASLVGDLMSQPETPAPGKFALVLEPYALAWRRLWTTKWLLWVFGTLAVIGVLSSIISAVVTALYKQAMMVPTEASPMSPELFTNWVVRDLPHWTSGALARFTPRVASPSWDMAFVVAAVACLAWAVPRLFRLRREPGYSRKAGFYGACVGFMVIAAVCLSVYSFLLISSLVGELRQSVAPAADSVRHPHTSSQAVRFSLKSQQFATGVGIVISTILSAVVIGGILGSLTRSRKGESVTRETFLSDSVSHFEPLGAFYLIFGLLDVLFLLANTQRPSSWLGPILGPVSMLTILLMFAPFAISAQGLSFYESLRRSLSIWRRTTLNILLFIAPGAFFCALYRGVVSITSMLVYGVSWGHVAVAPLFALAAILVQAVILLAVWEFYSKECVQQAVS